MKKTFRVLSLLAVAALVALAANAQTSLAVTGAAALDGNFGLAVIFASSTDIAYVQDDTPNEEGLYNAEFKLQANGNNFFLAVDDRHEVFVGRNPANLIRLEVACRATTPGTGNCGAGNNGVYRVRSYYRKDANTWGYCGQAGFVPTGETTWGFEWGQGTGGADGFMRFLKNGSLVRECTNIDNDDRGINAARMGATGRVDAGTTGTSHMDTFVSTRG